MSVRLGVLGCSRQAQLAIAKVVREVPDVIVTAAASRTQQSVHDFIERGGLSDVRIMTPRELVEGECVDALYIALPNALHVEWTLAAINNGKHVLVEKPMALDEAGCIAIEDAAARNRVCVLEGVMTQHHPWVDAVRDLVTSRAHGELRELRTRLCFILSEDRLARIPALSDGGGVFRDLAPYWLQFVDEAIGLDLLDVESRLVADPQNRFDIEANVCGRRGTVRVKFFASYRAAYDSSHELVFEHATVKIPDLFRANVGACRLSAVTDGRTTHFEPQNYFVNQLRAFNALIAAPRAVQARALHHSTRRQRVVDAVLRQAVMAGAQ